MGRWRWDMARLWRVERGRLKDIVIWEEDDKDSKMRIK
jgi:hypothetical protein